MKKNLLLVLCAVCLVGTLRYLNTAEAATPRTNAIPHVSPERFDNLIIGAPKGSLDYDFAAIGGGAINCIDSIGIVTTGATFGDACLAGSNHAADGGAVLSIEVQLSCYVSAANETKIRVCAARADAGTVDLADAGWFTKVIH